MAKEPWEEDIYDNGEKDLKRTKKSSDVLANRVLTILAVIFFIMVIVIVAGMIYLSVGGGFLDTSAPASSQVASSAPAASSETSSESTTASSEGTITVQAGEGEAAIAARAGISIAELERLNPSHMTTGSWYANPGDVVKTR